MHRLLRFGVGLVGFALFASSEVSAFDIVSRWNATQVNGGNLQRGMPTTLRWSIVPDGQSYQRSGNSNLIQFLDDGWNVPAAQRVPNFTNRPWWTVINNAYAQFGRVSGINMVYVPEQNADGMDTGMEGDIRIGGENIDGTPGGALADNVFPDGGDMRIDTTREANGSVGSYFSTEPGLRNLIIHESGHGVGLGHADFVNNSAKAVMEGGLRTDIWGFQFDDVYALNRQYGDPREQGNGNDALATATTLGSYGANATASFGIDALDSVVNQFDDDWLGIDGSSDTDYLKFSVTDKTFANIRLTPVGPTYNTPQQGEFNAAAQSDLVLQLFNHAPTFSLIATANQAGIGAAETIASTLLSKPGDYLIRVRGTQDLNQFYRIDLLLRELPIAGSTADINLDGATSVADWEQFLVHSFTDLSGLSPRQKFERGDLDQDGDNDRGDFLLFKSLFNAANGPNAFAQLLGVPEPGAISLAGIAAITAFALCRRSECR
ncbi:MAG TPA: hypothetical protein VF175_15580 [Lacipirellula sp.]